MAKIQLDVVTPNEKVLSVECDEVRAPGADGLFGVRPGHTPFLSVLEAGELAYVTGGTTHRYAVGGGFVEVANDHVIVLADTAESAAAIDVARATRAQAEAMGRLAKLTEKDPEYPVEAARVKRAAARVAVARGGAR